MLIKGFLALKRRQLKAYDHENRKCGNDTAEDSDDQCIQEPLREVNNVRIGRTENLLHSFDVHS